MLEEGDYTGEIQEVYDRRRRSMSGQEFLEKPKVQNIINKIDAVQLAINEHLGEPISEHKEKARHRRSFKGDKGLKGGQPLHQEVSLECHDQPRQSCSSVPRQVCVPVPSEVCRDVPREVCTQVEHCKDIPQKDCSVDYKEVTISLISSDSIWT